MRISDNEVKKILDGQSIVDEIVHIGKESDREADEKLTAQVTQNVLEMGDREDLVADLKARIEAGTYNPTGDDIADAMIRRSIADRIR
ncbi:MAG: flagellar biosynthesis anti-sigma factor FlgM [Armatimonadetes bacterium]|nr:flagellar biosynthesis anti-sigma factor FlgM [Armatimonadota bacterium]